MVNEVGLTTIDCPFPPGVQVYVAPPGEDGIILILSNPQKSHCAEVGLVWIHLNCVLALYAATGIGIEY